MLFQSQIPDCFQNTLIHKTKEAPNLSATNDKDWKSRLWGGSMVIFPVEPHLMVVFNNGSIIPSLDMLHRKWIWFSKLTRQTTLITNTIHEQTPSSKWWKRLVFLTMICLLIIMKLTLWKCGNLHRPADYLPGDLLMSPNARASFSLWWHKWNTFSSSTSCMSPDNLFSSAWFQSSGVVLIIHNKCMHLIIYFNPGVIQLFLHTAFLSAVQHSHRDACSQQQHRCLTAAHNQQHSQVPFQEFVWQHNLPSPHYHEFCKHRAKPSMQPHLVHWAFPDHILCLL